VLVKTPICYTKHHTLFRRLLVIASCAAPTTSSKKNKCAAFMSLQTFPVDNPVDSVPQWCNMNRKFWAILFLYSNTRTSRRARHFDNTFRSIVHNTMLLVNSALPMPKNKFSKCRTICKNFMQLCSMIKKLYKFESVR
jgi:hypothetical protein